MGILLTYMATRPRARCITRGSGGGRAEVPERLRFNLRLCPSQNNGSNNLSSPLRSPVMSALCHAVPQSRQGGFCRPPGGTSDKSEGGGLGRWEDKKTARRRSGRRSLMVFRCRAFAAIVSPSVRRLLLHRISDGWAAPSYE